jgi:hypothetical protein
MAADFPCSLDTGTFFLIFMRGLKMLVNVENLLGLSIFFKRSFGLQICGKECIGRKRLHNHMQRKHPRDQKFVTCEHCQKVEPFVSFIGDPDLAL